MNPLHLNKSYTYFDKHKSWYKLDIDGEYITKSSKTDFINYEIPKKRYSKNTQKVSKICEWKSTKSVYEKRQKPESLSKTHSFILKASFNLCFTLIMTLAAYCGYSYMPQSSIILNGLKTFERLSVK